MNKKLLLLFSALILTLSAWATDFTVDGVAYIITDVSNKTVAIGTGGDISAVDAYTSGAFTIPSSVTNNGTTYTVTAVGNSAFLHCEYLEFVTIPASVTYIGNSAFSECYGLNSVTIPESVTYIGNSAFYNCGTLNTIYTNNADPSKVTLGINVFTWVNKYTCRLCVSAGSKSAYQAADQWKAFALIEEATLSVSATTASIGDAANSTTTVDVTSNTVWTASSNQTWLTVSSASATGNGTLTFTAAANTIASTRTATVTVSVSGTNQTITVTQGATQDNALNFDGTDDYVNCGVYNPVTFTIEAWVNPNVVNTDQAIVSTLSELTITGCELHIGHGGVPAFTTKNAAGWANTIGTTPISSHTWTHLAATYDGSNVKLYVNGVLSATTTPGTCTPGSAEMHIGKRSVGISGWYYFSGTIDEVRVWNTALTVTQIAANMYNRIDNPASAVGLTRYFTFYQGMAGGSNSGITTLIDASASAKNGTLNNFALTGSTSNWVKGCRVLSLSATTASIGAADNSTATVDIASNTTWSALSDQTWLTISPASGKGSGTLTFTAVANLLIMPRTATVTILATGVTIQTITVTQQALSEAAKIVLSAATADIGAAANSTTTVNVTSNTTWSASSDQTWLNISPASASGNSTLTFTATANLVVKTRTATITVSATGATSQTITITQEAAQNNSLNFNGTNNYVDCGGFNPASYTIEAWVNPNVVNVDQAVVSTLSISANTGCELHIGSAGIPVFTIRSSSAWVDTKGTVPISANAWTHLAATYDGTIVKLYVNGFLSASSNSGSYSQGSAAMDIGRRSSDGVFFNGAIDEVSVWNSVLTVTQIAGNMYSGIDNPATTAGLTRYFTFNQGTAGGSNNSINTLIDASATVQNGILNNFGLTGSTSNWVAGYLPKVLSLSAINTGIGATEGSTANINVFSNLAWATASNQTWLTVTPASATGNGTLTFIAAANPLIIPRTATVTVTATGATSQTITVTQQATSGTATLGVSATTATIGAATNSTATEDVTSNTTWTAISNQTWLTVSPASGTGNGTLTYTAAANPLLIPRTATVTISATGATSQTITVTQQASAAAATLGVSAATASIGALANSTATVDVTSNTAWTASSNQTWLTVSPGATGNGTLTFTAKANIINSRIATVTVSATGATSQTITVTQDAATNNALSFNGQNDYVNCGHYNPDIFTIEAWVNPTITNINVAVVSTLSESNSSGCELYIGSDGIPVFKIRSASGWVDTKSILPISEQEWTHLAATYDGTTAKLYINGLLSGTSTAGLYTKGSSEMLIGWRSSGGALFKGVIDEVSVWNTVLTETQIRGNLYNGIDNPASEAGLTRYFTFNQGTAGGDNRNIATLVDASASAQNATLLSFSLSGSTSNWVTGYRPTVLNMSAIKTDIKATEGATATIDVSSNLIWTAVSDQTWLTVSPASATGNGTLTFTAAVNPTTAKRTATVTVSATGTNNQVITITQEAALGTGAITLSVLVPADRCYKKDDVLDFTITFDKPVVVSGNPSLSLTLNTGGTVQANYLSGSGSTNLVFRYTVAADNFDNDGITVGVLSFEGGSIQNTLGTVVNRTLNGVASTTGVKVDAVAPTELSFNETSNTYIMGQNLDFTATFNEDVIVDTSLGIPYIQFASDPANVRRAYYVASTPANKMLFRYTITNNDYSHGILTNMNIQINGGTVKDAAGNNAKLLSYPNVFFYIGNVNIDGVIPTIIDAIVPANGMHVAGNSLTFTLNFSEAVNVVTTSGTPYIALTLDNKTVNAPYIDGTGTTSLVFQYTVANGDLASNGIAMPTSISLNGATIKDISGNNANLTFTSPATSGIKVDAVTPVISGDPTVPTGNYTTGQHIDISITYSENVVVTGSPYILLTIGNSTVQANYQSGSATNTLVFRYTITATDYDADGITIGADIMGINSAIKDEAGNTSQFAFNTLTLSDVFVNVTSPAVTTQPVTAITGTTAIGNGDITSLGSVNPTQYGVVWSTASNPTIALPTKTSQGSVTATGAFTCNITNLLPLTQYYVKAYVTNNGGTSYGDEVTFITADIVPDAPTDVNATAGNAKAIISFSTPAPNGGTAVTQYTVTSSPEGRTATGTASPITLTGLTNGTSYTFTVVATNALGNSIASAPSVSVTPFEDANGVEVTSVESLRLYPNPATDQFKIEGVGTSSTLKLYNLNGNLLMSIEPYNGTSVKVSHLPSGTYLVKVNEKVFRFVKE